MTKFEVIILFVVFLKYIYIAGSKCSDAVDVYHQANDRLFAIIDDLFISLKIKNDLIKTKTAEEYMSSHGFIQDALRNNHKKYKQVYYACKTKINHKIARYISKINDVIEEVIRNETVTNNENRNDSNTYAAVDQRYKRFFNLAKKFDLNIKTFTPIVPKSSDLNSDSSEDARRIFEGSSTGIKRYPFMVSVHVASRFICAGSLLHESLAISAASCLMATDDMVQPPIQVRVGSDFVSKKGSLVNISDVIFHPEFNRSTLANNLVLLRTRKALRFQPQRVVAIQYDRDGLRASEETKDIIILGWGRRRTDENDLPEGERPLSVSKLETYNFEACKYIYTSQYVTDKTFCAGFVDRGSGACNHDGGGPALADGVLAGVISFGSPRCGRTDAPTVFTRLTFYADWIENVLENLAKMHEDHPIEPRQPFFTPGLPLDIQDVYRQNIDVENVLYGPIEMTEGDYVELFNKSTKQKLIELADNPNLYGPNMLAEFKPKPSTPILPPEGFWRDVSMEQSTNIPRIIESETSTANTPPTPPPSTFPTLVQEIVDSNSERDYENAGIAIPNTTETKPEEPFYGVGSTEVETVESSFDDRKERIEKPTPSDTVYEDNIVIETNNDVSRPVTYRQFTQMLPLEPSEENDSKERIEKSTPSDAVYEDNQVTETNSGVSQPVTYIQFTQMLRVPLEPSEENDQSSKAEKPTKIKFENTKENKLVHRKPNELGKAKQYDKAVIIMYDSGTTKRLEVDKRDPLYERGFKVLAAKVDKQFTRRPFI